MANYLAYLLTFVGGCVLAFQIGMNHKLGATMGNIQWGVFFSFVLGTLVILILQLAIKAPTPDFSGLASMPKYAWFGGALGAFYVLMITVIAPRIGFAVAFALVVAGQLCSSLFIDHFGIMGATKSPISFSKLLGIALVLLGIYFAKD